MNYNTLVENALRGVVRTVLHKAADDGLPGTHHFYIGFRTHAPGVAIPDYLRERYPDEMTIVVQHQFWGLDIEEDWFEITLSFNKRQERLHIPFAAITSFFDPSVQFGLQFQPGGAATSPRPADAGNQQASPPTGALPAPAATDAGDAPNAGDATPASEDDGESGDNVVTLDQFRKK